jgi:hypothetical protein
MLEISENALAIIKGREEPLFLDLPKTITNCCFDLQECPDVRFGMPPRPAEYRESIIKGITVFVPRIIADLELTIEVTSFFGIKKLTVKGWRYC